jgi:hypothetical protein
LVERLGDEHVDAVAQVLDEGDGALEAGYGAEEAQ